MRILILTIAVLATACSGATTGSTTRPSATPKPSFATYPPNFSPDVPTLEPTEILPEQTEQYKAGDTVTVTVDGADWAQITVTKVSVKKRYDGPYNIDDVPKKGRVYIQAFVTYKALVNGVDYNQFDWQVFVNDEAVDELAFVTNGPTPELNSGTLPKGRKASGWVVYEVPASGIVRMSYGGGTFNNEAPVFEVTIRSK